MRSRSFVFCLLLVVSLLCSIQAKAQKYEMRGAWIATVAGIDWPKRGLDSRQQSEELVQMIHDLKSTGINAIFLQVRPTADAFYESDLEPWSQYLTGTQGRAPQGGFDPLAVAIETAHNLGVELHAWINPYRVTNGESVDKLTKNHIYFARPELFVQYGGKVYFDPGKEEVRDYLVSVVMDIVLRYDVDGIHLDDYFYPYKVAGAEFPDYNTFISENRGVYDRKEWRRDNVNLVVSQLSERIHSAKPWVEFGVSPFGVWRNSEDDFRGSPSKAGCTNYDELYADVVKWLDNRWLDYVAPQLYWELGRDGLDFNMLSSWWKRYANGQRMYAGLYASGLKVKTDAAWKTPNEICRQIRAARKSRQTDGFVFYSAKYLISNEQGLADSLRSNFFRFPALVPASETSNHSASPAPKNIRTLRENGNDVIRWTAVQKKGGYDVSYYVVYAFADGEDVNLDREDRILAKTNRDEVIVDNGALAPGSYQIVVTSVNRFRKESKRSKSTWLVVR